MYSRIVWFVWFLERNERRKKQQSSIWDWDMLRAKDQIKYSGLGQLPLLQIRKIVLCNIGQFLFACPICSIFLSLLSLERFAWDFLLLCFLYSKSFSSCKMASLATNKPSKAFFPLLVLFVCTFRRCSCRLCSALQFPKLTFFLWKKAAQFSVLSCWFLQCKYVNKNSHTLSVLKSPDEFPFSPPLWSQSPLLFQCLVECPN